MKAFTVVGYWMDSLQRFSTHVQAIGPDEAEDACIYKYPGVAVCAVLSGRRQCVETAEYMRAAPE